MAASDHGPRCRRQHRAYPRVRLARRLALARSGRVTMESGSTRCAKAHLWRLLPGLTCRRATRPLLPSDAHDRTDRPDASSGSSSRIARSSTDRQRVLRAARGSRRPDQEIVVELWRAYPRFDARAAFSTGCTRSRSRRDSHFRANPARARALPTRFGIDRSDDRARCARRQDFSRCTSDRAARRGQSGVDPAVPEGYGQAEIAAMIG